MNLRSEKVVAASYLVSSALLTRQRTTHFQFEWNGLSVCGSCMLVSWNKQRGELLHLRIDDDLDFEAAKSTNT